MSSLYLFSFFLSLVFLLSRTYLKVNTPAVFKCAKIIECNMVALYIVQ